MEMQWFVEAAAGTDRGAGDAPGNQILRGSMGGTLSSKYFGFQQECVGVL